MSPAEGCATEASCRIFTRALCHFSTLPCDLIAQAHVTGLRHHSAPQQRLRATQRQEVDQEAAEAQEGAHVAKVCRAQACADVCRRCGILSTGLLLLLKQYRIYASDGLPSLFKVICRQQTDSSSMRSFQLLGSSKYSVTNTPLLMHGQLTCMPPCNHHRSGAFLQRIEQAHLRVMGCSSGVSRELRVSALRVPQVQAAQRIQCCCH